MAAVSTHVVESCVIAGSVENAWAVLSAMDFSWWSIVDRTELVSGASLKELDAAIKLFFKDGLSWVVGVRELSSINHSVTIEVIESEPATSVSSVVHTISLKKITTGAAATYVEWVSDFSSDANAAVVVDSSYKRREAFADLARAVLLRA